MASSSMSKCEDNPKPIGSLVRSLVPKRFIVGAFLAACIVVGLLSAFPSAPASGGSLQTGEPGASAAERTDASSSALQSKEAAKMPADSSAATTDKSDYEKYVASKTSQTSSFTDKMTKYMDVDWDELPQKAQSAAIWIGMDEERWDRQEYPDIYWDEFTDEQKKALEEDLGWDEDAWTHQYSKTKWNDLPEVAKKAATSLGLTEDMWNDDKWPSWRDDTDWDDFEEEEKRALMVLGWTPDDWDAEEDEDSDDDDN